MKIPFFDRQGGVLNTQHLTLNRVQSSTLFTHASQAIVDRVAPALIDRTHTDCVAFSPGEWLRAYWVLDWPSEMAAANWRQIVAAPINLRISLFHEPRAPEQIRREIAQQKTAANATRVLRWKLKQDASPSLDNATARLTEEQIEVEVRGNPLYDLTTVMGVTATSREELEQACAELENLCARFGLIIRRAQFEQDKGMLALLPYAWNVMGVHLSRNASINTLAPLFPFVSDEIVDPEGVYFGHTSDGRVTVIDPFKFDNPHILIVGKSGSGKSFCVKDYIEQSVVQQGHIVYATDIEGEYELLCKDLGGQYVDMSLNSPTKINVLDPNPQDPEGLAGAQLSFEAWLRAAIDRDFAPAEVKALDIAYTRAFEKKGMRVNRTLTLSQVYDAARASGGEAAVEMWREMLAQVPAGETIAFENAQLYRQTEDLFVEDNRAALFGTPPVLSDLHEELERLTREDPESAAGARVLADLIYPLAIGREAQAWNCQTNLDLQGSPLVMFGLRDVADRMKAKRLKQIQLFTWNQYLRDRRRKVEVVDECWWLMNNEVTAQDLAERAARLRKYNVGLVLATQKVSDFAANRHADKVLTQAETYLIFGQKITDIDQVGDLFRLTDVERQALTGAKKGDFLMVTKAAHLMMRKYVAADRAELYSTSPKKERHALAR